MKSRTARRLVPLALLAFSALPIAACGGSERMDQNYGKDAALGYQGPDGGILSGSRDAQTDDAAADAGLNDGPGEDTRKDADELDAAPPDTAGDTLLNAASPTPNN